MTGETSPRDLRREINPIFQGAEQLRSLIKSSVQENLTGIFPKNSHYMVGDYNLIYVISEKYGDQHGGFCEAARMVVLTPTGEIKSGRVRQRVESYYSSWEFREVTLTKASDLEVVRCTPQLVMNLFKQLEDELSEEKDPVRIQGGINYLANNQELYAQVSAISHNALKEMGEEEVRIVLKDTGQPDDQEFLASIAKAFEEQNPQYKIVKESNGTALFDQKKAAIDLFMDKNRLTDEIKDIAFNMRASLVEQRFGEIVGEIVSKNIFPTTWIDKAGVRWFGNKEIDFNTLSKPIYSEGVHRGRFWSVSMNGQVREFEKKPDGTYESYFCAEHLLQQAPTIMRKLINQSAKNFFRKIEV